MISNGLTLFDFFAEAAPFAVLVACVIFYWRRHGFENWFSGFLWLIFVSAVASVITILIETGSFAVVWLLLTNTSEVGFRQIFQIIFRFLIIFYLVAGLWMVLGCLGAGIALGFIVEKVTK